MSDETKDQRPRVNDITREDFNQWATSKVTLAYRKFLQDYGRQLIRDHDERWLNGTEENEQEARGRALTHLELEALTFDHMQTFYRSINDEEIDERKTTE